MSSWASQNENGLHLYNLTVCSVRRKGNLQPPSFSQRFVGRSQSGEMFLRVVDASARCVGQPYHSFQVAGWVTTSWLLASEMQVVVTRRFFLRLFLRSRKIKMPTSGSFKLHWILAVEDSRYTFSSRTVQPSSGFWKWSSLSTRTSKSVSVLLEGHLKQQEPRKHGQSV